MFSDYKVSSYHTTRISSMKVISAVCLWALAIICFTKSVKSTSAIDVDKTNYRLPNETYPEHYDIQLTTNVHTGEKAFQGEVTIDIRVVSATNKIVLHAHELEVFKANITNQLTKEVEDLSIDYESKRQFLTLKRRSGANFSVKPKWKLTLIYSGELRDDQAGFYLSKYKHDDGTYHYLAATFFESINARYVFPCYDEPNKRANFTITINHSPTYTAISNMPVNSRLSSANRTVFLTTPSMPTYLVGFIVSDFIYTEVIVDNLPQRIYSRPNAKILHEQFLQIISQIMKYVTDYFNVKFMIPKIDYVLLPELPLGGEENWGMITYDEKYFQTFDDDVIKHYNEQIIAHEIIHQWFGNYVTISSWEYFWLKESITVLYSFKILNHFYPEANMWHLFHNYYYSEGLNQDSGDSSIALTNYVQTSKEIEDRNVLLIYHKSSAVMRMWNNALTDKVFQQGLHNFLEKNQYQAVGEEELFYALQAAINEEKLEIPVTVNEMFSTWTHQRGYPILTVARNYTNGTFTIKQETYYNNENIKDSKTWYVPINYAVASNPNFSNTKVTHYLLNVAETNFSDVKISKNDWLILNKQSIGYYRVNYDEMNWNLIIQTLIENHLVVDARNRAQLLSDAIALWNSNRLGTSVLFKLFTYLNQEEQYICWKTVADYFEKMVLYLKLNEKYNDLIFFLDKQLDPIYKKLSLVDESRENYYQKTVRGIITDLKQKCDLIKGLPSKKIRTKQIRNLLRKSINKSFNLENEKRYYVWQVMCPRDHLSFSICINVLKRNWNAYGNLKNDGADSYPLNDQLLEMASYIYEQNQATQLLALVDKVKNSKLVLPTLEIDVKSKLDKNVRLAKKYNEEIIPWVTEYRRKARIG